MSKKKQTETPAPEQAKTTALTTREPNQTAMTRDDFSQLGETAIGSADVQMPRLKLLQGLSQPVVDQEAFAGNFWNSLTSENYGPAVKFVPVLGFKNRVYLEQGKGLMCRSIDMIHGIGNPGIECEKCALKDWPEDRSEGGPKCRESRNWVGLIVGASGETERKKGDGTPPIIKDFDEPQFIVLQFTSMASAAAKKLNGLYVNSRMTNPKVTWSDLVFSMVASPAKTDKGSFFLPDVRPAGRSNDAQKASAKSLLEFLSGRTLVVDVDADDDQPGPVTPQPGQPSF